MNILIGPVGQHPKYFGYTFRTNVANKTIHDGYTYCFTDFTIQ